MRFLFFKLKWQVEKPAYNIRCYLFDLCSLERRRELYSIIFIRDIVHYRIKCDVLVSLLNFYFPARAFHETFHFRN